MAIGGSVPRRYSIAEARDRLAAIVHDAEDGAPVELTRRGEPVAVLVGMRRYRRLAAGRPDFWDALLAFRRRSDLGAAHLGDPFAGVRDRSPGGSARW